jgi:hypothetical protein
MILTATTASGCLITDDLDIPEETNFPPSIVSDRAADPALPIEEIVVLRLDEVESLTFPVIVRDPNIEEPLEWLVLLNFVDGASPQLLDGGNIAPSGSIERQFDFTLDGADLSRLTPGECHKIELRVSRAFQGGFDFYLPEEPGDLDVAVWWIDSVDESSPTLLSNCSDPS